MKNSKQVTNFKDKLKAKRSSASKPYTQEALAKRLKKSQTLVSMMINGKRTPSEEFIKAISNL